MRVTRTFDVVQRGVGKPDYTKEVSASRERAGIALGYEQQLKTFLVVLTDRVVHPYAIPWVKDVLAPGATTHLYDISTGLPTPYSQVAGYVLTEIQTEFGFSEDVEVWLYMDGFLVGNPAIVPGGSNMGWNMVIPNSTLTVDPTGLLAHTYDIQIVNRGLGDLSGVYDVTVVVEAVGTPPWPTVKECLCPLCNYLQTVPVESTRIICSKCGKLFIVYDLSRIRRL